MILALEIQQYISNASISSLIATFLAFLTNQGGLKDLDIKKPSN